MTTSTTDPRLLEAFRREYEATRSLEAAVSAVATAIRARDEERAAALRRREAELEEIASAVKRREDGVAEREKRLVRLVVVTERRPRREAPSPLTLIQADYVHAVIVSVCALAGVTREKLVDNRRGSRARPLAYARFVAMALLRRKRMSLNAIAAALGLEDHVTVLNGLRRVAEMPELGAQVEEIARALEERRPLSLVGAEAA